MLRRLSREARDFIRHKFQVRYFGKDDPKCPSMKITVCGASGQIGQPLSLMLKQCPYIDELALYDLSGACGVGLELSHVDTKCKVRAYTGREQLKESLKNARIVIFAAGLARKPGMTRDDLFCSNARVVQELAAACGEVCPELSTQLVHCEGFNHTPTGVNNCHCFNFLSLRRGCILHDEYSLISRGVKRLGGENRTVAWGGNNTGRYTTMGARQSSSGSRGGPQSP